MRPRRSKQSARRSESARAAEDGKTEDINKKEVPRSVREMTELEFLLKKWDFWQSEYRWHEKDVLTPPNVSQKKMEEIKKRLQFIKKSYENQFGHPLPGRDYTATQYPPQTRKQQEALGIYEQFKRISEAHKKAADMEAYWLNRLRETPILNTRKDAEHREAFTMRKEALEEQLKQIEKEWADKFQRDLGPLKTEIIPDPLHERLDTRKDRRQVDAMESKIKGGDKGEDFLKEMNEVTIKRNKARERDRLARENQVKADQEEQKKAEARDQLIEVIRDSKRKARCLPKRSPGMT